MKLDPALIAPPARLASINRQGRRLLSSGLMRRSFVYTASVSLSALTNFLLLPILTRYLSPADYGIIETFLSLSALLTAVIVLGANTSLSREYFKLTEGERSLYLGNALCLIVAAGVLVGMVIVIRPVTLRFGRWLHLPVMVVVLAALAAIAKAVMSMTQVLFQLQKRVAAFAIFTNSTTLGELALSVLLIVGLGLAWRGRVTAIAATYTIAALVALVWLRRTGMAQIQPMQFSRSILRSSVPLVVAQLAGWTQMMVDRLIISHLVNPSATGLYAVGSRFAMVVLMIETSFSLAWLPFIYEGLNQRSHAADRKIVQATYLYSLFLIGFSLAFGLGSRFLLYAMVPRQYFGAGKYIFLLSMAYCADGIWKLFLGYLLHDNRSSVYSAILCGSALLDVCLGYVLVTHFGPIGAAWATLASFVLGTVATIVAAVRTHKMPWLEVFFDHGQRLRPA